ncbi:MAG TPA: efflux RND transporter periplasmic adaptor subunit [Vicinamibacterales bacterium]|jgi:cobalt-zinc-cadmium efflux system membrane fusion protein
MKLTIPAALLAAAALAACSGPPAPVAAAQGSPAPAGYFTVPAAQMPQLKITTVHTGSLPVEVKATGTVDWDNDHTTQAITPVSGPITRIAADLGTRVRAGAPLLYVASPDIATAISAYRSAQNHLSLAKRTLDRNHDLMEHHAIAQKDLDQSQADYNDAATAVQAALQTLRIYGIRQADLAQAEKQDGPITPDLAMRAPISGTVVQKLVLPGQIVQAGSTAAFVISDTSTVWVQGHLYEQDLQRVRIGGAVDVTTAAFPGRTFHGTVTYIGAALDPATRTTPVRIVTRNPDGLLKKDQFVDIVIHSKARQDALTVPTSAVLYNDDNFPFVYVRVSGNQFAQRLVKTGVQEGDAIQVLDGLKDGDAIVSQGSVFLQFAQSSQS